MKVRHVVLLAVALLIFVARFRPQRILNSSIEAKPAAPAGLRITQFYPATPKIAIGEKTVLCYGVDNATAVRITPPVEELWPALTRCIEVKPSRTTQYTLIAEDGKGAVSQATTVEVGPPRPKIIEVSVNKLAVSRGEQVLLCFKAGNASDYDVGGLKPATILGQRTTPTSEHGCFTDRPAKTKTYTVRVTGPGGDDSESVTVRVK